jgi:alkanesulfonate monooxygenase SsuD/methylene tetrahydromethanopterin reductase-like flavin-dependent oxidoreductase (luciferase family)
MELGTGLYTCQLRPDDDRSMADLYAEMLTVAEAADDAGLDSVWVSEHHFADDGYLSGTMPSLGALAAATDDVEIGTCIALAPLYDGVRLAEDAATIDNVSSDRLTLGLAIGSNPDEFDAFGVPHDERVERLVDQVDLLQAAWSEGALDYDAEFHDVSPDVNVTPKPVDNDVPIMLGGGAKPAVRRAARTADAWCAPSKLSLGGLEKRVDDIATVRENDDIEGEFTNYVIKHGWVGDSKAAAWETMRDGYFYIQRRYAEIFSGEPVDELDDDRKQELKEQAIFGTPEQVVDELETYRDALGDDVHVIFRTYHPGVGTDEMVACVRRLGDEVAPELR